jgi:hypothetical protein
VDFAKAAFPLFGAVSVGGSSQILGIGGQFTGLGSFFHPTGVQTQGIGPDLLVKSNFTFGFVW